ncbi:hypothetical protein IFM89_010935, partial [Coptis chinensis]
HLPSSLNNLRCLYYYYQSIILFLFSVVNLTLIDLPGMTKVAIEGQPDSIVEDIDNMVRSYVEKVRIPCYSWYLYSNFQSAYHLVFILYQELKRFPSLQADIAAAAGESLENFREDSRKTVLRLVEMESSYLTVDFFRKLPLDPEKGSNPSAPNMDRYADSHYRRIGSNVSAYVGMVCDTLRNTIPKAVVYCQVREAKRALLNYFYSQVGRRELLKDDILIESCILFSEEAAIRNVR